MRCPQCQHESPSGARFCEECGAPLARACDRCGTSLSATAKFCHGCAHPVGASAAAPSRFVSPEAYIPSHLAEKILTSRTSLEGERKQVTVLFADLKGSMELLAERDPEEARKLLDPVLDLMMEAVHRYEGTVNQVMGDGIMALFGAPLAHEDHAVRACYAALRLQESGKRYAETVQRTAGVPIQIRVGVNSGEVVVRSIGSDLRMDYTAVGQTTHLAARMEQMAMTGSILIAPATLRLVEGFVQVRPLGPVNVRGLSDPVEVYEVTGPGPVRTRFQAATSRGLTRFVGRAGEIAELRRALERARGGNGQVVSLVGEPGVGKSRLFHEFTRSVRTAGWLVLESGAMAHGRSTAHLPVIDLLKGYFLIDAREEPRTALERVTGKVLSLDRALEPALPALLALLDLPGADPQWENLDPPLRRHRTLEAVKRLLIRESRVQPLLMVFEDLQWIDSETQAVLDSLVESLPAARILLLLNHRPEYRHAWAGRTYFTQLRLDPLPADSAEELLEALLGPDAALVNLKRFLIARSEGNPFFLEESVRTLVETKALAGGRGAHRLARPLDSIQVPETVQAILAARIDRLSAADKRLLQAAAVVGKDVPLALLRAVADQTDDELRGGLGRLQAAELLYETSLFPDLEYTFIHALTHEVAYGSLLHERRRTLHARIVETLETSYPDRLSEHVERLGHHAVHAEAWDKAVPYLYQAGAKAAARSATVEAIAHLTKGLDALAHLPEGDRRLRLELDLQIALGPSLMIARGYGAPDVARTYERARALCRRVGEDSELFATLHGLWLHHWLHGNRRIVLDLTRELLQVAERAQDPALRMVAHEVMGEVSAYLGDFAAARSHMAQSLALYDPGSHRALLFRYGGYDPGMAARAIGAHALWYLGHPDDALAWSRAGIAHARELSHPATLVFALAHAGILHYHRREPARTLALSEEAIALATDQGIQFWDAFSEILLGWSLAHHGRAPEGLQRMRSGLGGYRAAFGELESPLWLAMMADACREADAPAEGLSAVEEGLRLSTSMGIPFEEAELHRLRGELLLALGGTAGEEAGGCFRRAIDVAARQEALSLELRAALGLARGRRRTDPRDPARQTLAAAYERFTQGFDTADLREARALLDEPS